MSGNHGLHIGATFKRQIERGLLSDDLHTAILMRTAAASDTRMGGATLPAMSNSGSGNQVIAATLPVVVVAEYVQADDEALARALMLSHLMAIYIHSKLPKLSALCAVATAAAAAYKAVLMALDDSHVTGNDGIVEDSVDASIGNLCALACESMVNKAC